MLSHTFFFLPQQAFIECPFSAGAVVGRPEAIKSGSDTFGFLITKTSGAYRFNNRRTKNLLMKTVASFLVLALCFASPAFAQDAAASAPIEQEQLAANLHDTRTAAERGDADAQFSLGWRYANGRGVARNDAQAVSWYRKAADQGLADAQAGLGWMYANGRGVARNDAQAVAWYRKAAEQGHASAQYRLGLMYDEGRGVARDDAQAATWYRKAAEQGFPTQTQGQKVVVLVNGEPITDFDIEQRTKLNVLTAQESPSQQEILNELIDDKVELTEGKEYGVDPSASDIDQAYAETASRMRITPEQLTKELEAKGIRADTQKSRMKAEMVWSSLVRDRYKDRLQVNDRDVEAAVTASGEKSQIDSFEYKMQPVVLIVPEGSPQTSFDARQKEAEAYRARVQSCDEANSLFKSTPNAAIRERVTKTSADLPEPLREMLNSTPVGHLTPPEVTKQGIEMAALCSRTPTKVDSPKKREVRQKMYDDKYIEISDSCLQEIRKEAMIEYRHPEPTSESVNEAAPSGINPASPQSSSPANDAPPPSPSADCVGNFVPLSEEAERRGKELKAAVDRHASPAEACKLIGNFGQAELKLIEYVETHAAKCAIPQQVSDQLKAGHKDTEAMRKKVCDVAQRIQQFRPPARLIWKE